MSGRLTKLAWRLVNGVVNLRISSHWQILIALVASTLTALIFRSIFGPILVDQPDASAAAFVRETLRLMDLLGSLFMNALKMIIVPLIVSTVISSMASLRGIDGFKRLGIRTFSLYALTTLLATSLGLLCVNLIKPGLVNGKPNEEVRKAFDQALTTAAPSEMGNRFGENALAHAGDWTKLFHQLIPDNLFVAASDHGQMIGLIVVSLLVGIIITKLPEEKMRPLQQSIEGAQEVMLKLTQWVMVMAPIGIYALIFPIVYKSGGEVFGQLSKYFVTVLLGLFIHIVVIMPFLLKFVSKIPNPYRMFTAVKVPLLTAFSTASSSATLPETIRSVQQNAGVSQRTASFTLPLGATVNMDGTALYECVAVVFVAQVMGVELSLLQQFMVVFAALLTSVGVAGIPSASLVAILLILKNTQIPNAELAIAALFAVDRPLDMARTAVNVFGDSCVAVMVGRSEGEPVLGTSVAAESGEI